MGNKVNKSERVAYISKVLVENPSKVFTLQHFADTFSCAKSTLWDDISVIEELYINGKPILEFLKNQK